MADNIFQNGGVDSLWSTVGNWSLGAVPTATDGNVARFDATSPNCSLGAANRVCNAINFTGYTNTLTFGVRTLTVSGDAVLDIAGMTWTGTGTFAMNQSASLTTNAFNIPVNLQFTGTSKTYTLQDDVNIISGAALSLNGVTTLTINNNGTAKVIYAGGNCSSSAGGCQGTAKIVMNGTGAVGMTAAIRNDLEFNTAGTITVNSSFRYSTGTLTYTAGTIDTTTNSSTFTVGLGAVTTTTLDTGGINWYNITISSSQTVTLTTDLVCQNAFQTTATVTMNGPGNIRISSSTGTGFIAGGASPFAGTAKLIFDGTDCTWTGGTGNVQKDVDINTTGTLTLVNSNCNFRLATMTHISGTVLSTGGGYIMTTSSATWNTATVVLPAVVITTSNQTLNSEFYVTTLTLGTSSTVSFLGVGGFTVDNLIHTTTGKQITLLSGNTYTVNQSLLLTGSASPSSSTNSVTLSTSAPPAVAYFNVAPTATAHCRWVRALNIDSSGGRQLYTVKGLINDFTVNWLRTDPDPWLEFMRMHVPG